MAVKISTPSYTLDFTKAKRVINKKVIETLMVSMAFS